jgi:hypothetical protein
MANKPRDEDRVTLTTLKDGAAVELFEAALEEVLSNIEDPNIVAKANRVINIKVTFMCGEDRDISGVAIEVVTKLANRNAVTTVVHMGRRMGALIAVEYDPRQRDIFDPERGEGITPLASVAGGKKEEATSDD